MRKRNRMQGGSGKERAIMLAASVFVLGALTLTGVYVKESNTKKNDNGYSVDLSSLEKNNDTVQEKAEGVVEENDNSLSVQNPNAEYELDLEAVLEEGELENTDVTKKEEKNNENDSKDANETTKKDEETSETNTDSETRNEANEGQKEINEANAQKSQESASVSTSTWKALEFTEETGLVWPTVGEILINYSMDQTVYFPTLAQYKYNPAIVIAAAEGKTIVAAADAQVVEIFTDSEIGQAVRMDLGNGYELIYGQLADVQVSKGAYVSAGDVIGTVGAPTKYYSVEGSNLYVKLSKDGVPVNPLTLLPQ